MKLCRTTCLFIAIASLLPGTDVGAGQPDSAAVTVTISEDAMWGDPRQFLAAVRSVTTEQAVAGLKEGSIVDDSVRLDPLAEHFLPPLNPFSELGLLVVLSGKEAAIVDPRTRRILKVYSAPEDGRESGIQASASAATQAAPAASVISPPGQQRDSRPQVQAGAAPLQGKEEPQAASATQQTQTTTAGSGSVIEDNALAQDRTPVNSGPAAKTLRQAGVAANLPDPSNNGQLRTLLDRAEARRKIGDILGARQFLVLASQLGSIEALSRLAETYDAKVLAAWGVRGMQPDQEQAAKLYARANDFAAREGSISARRK